MKTIATLGPSVRLIVLQFHVKNVSVPEGIPKYSDFHKLTVNQFEGTGVRVMEPTPDVLLEFVAASGYQLIDAWHAQKEDWNRSVVRFVFCQKEHLNLAGLRPEFIAQRDGLLESFNRLADKNLWQTMAYINPFFIAGKATSETVLVLDGNSRKETVKLVQTSSIKTGGMEFPTEFAEQPVMVFQGGREKPRPFETIGQGIGPKVLLTDKANRLKLVGNDVVLVAPPPIPVLASAPIA